MSLSDGSRGDWVGTRSTGRPGRHGTYQTIIAHNGHDTQGSDTLRLGIEIDVALL